MICRTNMWWLAIARWGTTKYMTVEPYRTLGIEHNIEYQDTANYSQNKRINLKR